MPATQTKTKLPTSVYLIKKQQQQQKRNIDGGGVATNVVENGVGVDIANGMQILAASAATTPIVRKRKKVASKILITDGWQKHSESVKGYYYFLEGNWHAFVCVYRNEIRLHLREYFRAPDGSLIPTKTGATLWEDDFKVLKKIGPKAHQTWLEMSNGEQILNHALSPRSDYYLIIGPDETDELKFCIKICYPANDGESLSSTFGGASLSVDGWNKLLEHIEGISQSIEKMKNYIEN